jgi:PAS domain S-box-containing protein
MSWQSTPWADPLLASTVVSASLAVFGLLYDRLIRHDRRVVAFATVMLGTAAWTLGYSFQFASAELASKRTWAAVAMAGEAVVPAAWCTFALVYARRDEWLTRRRIGILWAIPALTVVLAATNGSHGLVRQTMTTATAGDGSYLVLDASIGPWMAVHGIYSYLVAFAGTVLMIDAISRTQRVYRGQAAVLLVGITIPAGANLVSLAGIGPAATVDLTPPSMAILGVAFAVGIFRYRLFDLVPVARSSVVENMGEGYVLLDEGNEVVDLNAAARSLLDGDDGRLLGRAAKAAFGADLSVLDTFDGETTTETITTGDPPEQRYVELTVSRIEADRAAGRLIAIRDVTDRIRIERRFRTLIEASSDIVFVLGETGYVEYASPSVEHVLGYDPDALVGEVPFEELIVDDTADDVGSAPDGSSEAAATWRRVLDGTGVDPSSSDRIRFEVTVRTAEGEHRTIEAIARYLVDDPAVEGIVINARDITERKQRELELERTNERLDRFASFVSHDLRNPLNVAMGRIDLAIETGDDEHLRTVQQQHERMSTMIEDLLTMARDGTGVEETTPVDLDTQATRRWTTVETGGASLVADTGATILADMSRLGNLFENLYRNAVEHAPADGDPASLTVRVESIPGGFAVSDDGTGIPADIREEITESGYTTEGDNTGYGLAIVEEIATAHGWDLTVTESATGGSRFEFTGVDSAPDTARATDVEPNAGGGSAGPRGGE